MMMMLMERGQARCLGVSHLVLFLLASFGSSHDRIRPGLICGMVQQRANVVNEQWVQQFGDFLFVREIERALKWNPRGKLAPSRGAPSFFISRLTTRLSNA